MTANKPKALVPVDNLPIIFHLFRTYPSAHFTVIADYKKEVLEKYLRTFATVRYSVVRASEKGTASGLGEALEGIPDDTPFMLIWCDLILSHISGIPPKIEKNYVGISGNFECRWSYQNSQFKESASRENGVAGLFIFKDKSFLKNVPQNGELVRWLATQNIPFERLEISGGIEIGTVLSYFQKELNKKKCRPFNKIEFSDTQARKIPLDKQGEKLIADEMSWYAKAMDLGFADIPKIYSRSSPLVMEKINGENVYAYSFLTKYFKKALLGRIIDTLDKLHKLTVPVAASVEDCEENYVNKTFSRMEKIKDLVPFANDEYIKINDKICKNPFAIKEQIIKEIRAFYPSEFHFIHGDCTFSNIMIENEGVRPILIDPRGYFGKTKFYGDIDYDWAKLYYSLCGDYDQFNRKNFSLLIGENSADLTIVSNNWKDMEDVFFEKTQSDKRKIKLLHALIWLSLTTYAWEDYDAICGAFYNGTLHLQEYLDNA
ncbi:MAG: phosphotransferase [Opitutae bacterium]|nr:phosphotransferase [Opitutae bacterium]